MATGIPFGHFVLSRRLARGGMAEVFLARQRGLEGFDRRVAVKRILPHLSERPDFVTMFLDEARLAARLSHPNIVHIYEFGKVDDDYFIAMEYVEGVHAGQLFKLASADPMPAVLVARIGADAASALAYAHRLEDADGTPLAVVHRDISPQNLLVSYDGVVKLVDFGIAKAAAHARDETRPGVVKGKYAYMSPEQTVGRALDGRSDVFSLAVILWELLAGRYIVDRGEPAEAMRAIRDGRFPAIEEVAPGVPAPLAAALGQALEIDADERATAAELGVALEAFIKSSPELATSMQLADWIRGRFPRTPGTSTERPAIEPVGGTRATSVASVASSVPAVALPPRDATILQTSSVAPIELADDDLTDAETARDERTALIAPSRAAIAAAPARARWPWVLAGVAVVGLAAVAWILLGHTATHAPAPDAAPRVHSPDAGAPDAAPAAQNATLDVLTTPAGATVHVGTATARAPASFADLAPGRHDVAIVLDGYQPETRTVTLAAGERRTLELELVKHAPPTPPPPPHEHEHEHDHAHPRASPGTLAVRTEPYSVVYEGAHKLGETPCVISLPAGNHTLRFVNPDKGTRTRTVAITAGATTKLKFAL